MSCSKQVIKETIDKIVPLLERHLSSLDVYWREMYGSDISKNNIKVMADHVDQLCLDVEDETIKKKEKIEKGIQDLRSEANHLEEQLQVTIDRDGLVESRLCLFMLQEQLNSRIAGLREQLKERKNEITKLLMEQQTLCEDMQCDGKELSLEPLASATELSDFRRHLSELVTEKCERIVQIRDYQQKIKKMCNRLETPLTIRSEIEMVNNADLQPTLHNIAKLQNLLATLEQQYDEYKESINSMRLKLKNLWECLGVGANIANYYANFTEYNKTTYDKLHEELQLREEEKRRNIKLFIDKIRNQISNYWEKTLKSQVERQRFVNFNSDCYTEDLLKLHELELNDLVEFYETNSKLFELVSKRDNLWTRMEALEEKEHEQDRYKNRGGQLLKEEKERKAISKQLPIIEQELEKLATQYEQENGRIFTVYGVPVMTMISEQYEMRNERKQQQQTARKKAQNENTIMYKSVARTPLAANRACISTIKKKPVTMSSTVKPIAGTSVMKSRLAIKRKGDENVEPSSRAKRTLFTGGHTPAKVQSTISSKVRSGLKKVVSSLHPNQHGKRMSNSKRRSVGKNCSRGRRSTGLVDRILTPPKSSSVTYESFQDCISNECRSSIMVQSAMIGHNEENRDFLNLQGPSHVVKTAGRVKTPLKADLMTRKSPKSVATPSPNNKTARLKTTNLPILI